MAAERAGDGSAGATGVRRRDRGASAGAVWLYHGKCDGSERSRPGGRAGDSGRGADGRHQHSDDRRGRYLSIPALLPGTYKVTISATGFTRQETSGVELRVNDIKSVDAQLKVGNAATEITVTTAPPLLQTDTADVRRDITSHELATLPIFGSQGGNFQAVLRTIPGSGLTDETNSLAGNPQRAINSNINGLSEQGINTRLDGVQDAYPWLPANVAYVPPSDAIETVNVVTNSFNAEQGNAGGAAVNVQVKSAATVITATRTGPIRTRTLQRATTSRPIPPRQHSRRRTGTTRISLVVPWAGLSSGTNCSSLRTMSASRSGNWPDRTRGHCRWRRDHGRLS